MGPFLRGLRASSLEKQDFVVDDRYAEGEYGRFPDLAAELVRLKVDIIVAVSTPGIRAAMNATSTIPIVMVAEGDPVKVGLVANLARPGRNVTGVTNMFPELAGKQLELLKETITSIARVAVLWNPTNPGFTELFRHTQVAAQALGVTLQPLHVRDFDDFEPAFSAMTRARADALIVFDDIVMGHPRIAQLALEHQLPLMSNWESLTLFGGLMSYAPSIDPMLMRAAVYVDKILKGAKPADLPVERPTEFELIINLNTANAVGLTIPDSILFRADKVIR
ncbi:MAG: ABC transporter substrate-binding protein [Candidatus Methylomirabilia bacterium]